MKLAEKQLKGWGGPDIKGELLLQAKEGYDSQPSTSETKDAQLKRISVQCKP